MKKSKKALGAAIEKQQYHKRVKSDQIYSVKLLMKNDDKLKNSKQKIHNHVKQPSLTRPATKKNEAIVNSGYSQFAFKKSAGLQHSLIQHGIRKNTFKSENCTPRKLQTLQRISHEAGCLAQANKKVSKVESSRKKVYSITADPTYKNSTRLSKGKRTTNVSLNTSSASHTITTNDLIKYKHSKNLSYRVSNAMSPARKVNNIEKNRK